MPRGKANGRSRGGRSTSSRGGRSKSSRGGRSVSTRGAISTRVGWSISTSSSVRSRGSRHSARSTKQYEDDDYEDNDYEDDNYDQDIYSLDKTSDRDSPVKIRNQEQPVNRDQDPSDVSVVMTRQSANQITDATITNINQIRNRSTVDNQERSSSITTHSKSSRSVDDNRDIRESSFTTNNTEKSYSINKRSRGSRADDVGKSLFEILYLKIYKRK